MGCLFEMFLEVFIEGILSLFMFVYLKVAHVLVPNKTISQKSRDKIKNMITIISALLLITMFIGITFLSPDDAMLNTVGKYMTFIPLSIIGLQVVLSIVVMIVKIVKRRKK